jgi:murein DD-endopeptidase MepM/ murein hydrolase activator NlpD
MLLFSFSLNNNFTSAEDDGEKLKEELDKIKQAQNKISEDMELTEEEIKEIEDAHARLEQEIKRVDLAIAEARINIANKNEEIAAIELEIATLKKDIEVLVERLKKRDELLKNRMRSLQENGGTIDYLNVILGAKSFGDFLDRVSAVTTIVEQDKLIIKKHQEEMELLEELKGNLTTKLNDLEQQLIELQVLNDKLNEQRLEKESYLGQLEIQHAELHRVLDEQETDLETLAAQKAAKEKAIAAYEEKKRQEEEEAKRKKEEQELEQRSGLPAGTFIRPSQGYVTSEYGPRWGRTHTGIDLARSGYVEPAVASAEGVVFKAEYYGNYGNVVFITHYIEGLTFTTVYAHLDRIDVTVGQQVSQGQAIGLVGNTGFSTGPHLHFELIEGDWDSRFSNRVDPRDYINF